MGQAVRWGTPLIFTQARTVSTAALRDKICNVDDVRGPRHHSDSRDFVSHPNSKLRTVKGMIAS